MRSFVVVVGCIASLGAATAFGSAAVPMPLERRIDDAKLVVVAKLRTRPVHGGDPFTVDVEETLKGRAPAADPLSVIAGGAGWGCEPRPADAPPPASVEGRGRSFVLFLDADGRSSDPIFLDPDERASAWIGDLRPSAQAPAAIRALVALDAETDAARAVALWEKGLADGDGLLAACLLHRIEFAASSPKNSERWLGDRLTPLARAQFDGAKDRLLPHVTRFAASADVGVRRAALRAAFACFTSKSVAAGPAFDALLDACRKASHETDVGVRDDAFRCLAAARDPQLPDRLLAGMKKRPLDWPELRGVGAVGRELLFASYPDREHDFLAATAAMLDDPATENVGAGTLAMLTHRGNCGPELWRRWWKERETK